MNAADPIDYSDVEVADSWGTSVADDLQRSARRAWIAAAAATAIAFLLAIALVVLLPLRTVEPYTLLVDRQTGHVEALDPMDAATIAPDAALTRSFLVQYVIAREGFDADDLARDYRRVALMSAGNARQRYVNSMQANNPASPLAFLPPGGEIDVEVRSVSSLSADSALVRYSTTRTDPGAQSQDEQYWAAVIDYGFTDAAMAEEDRYLNPLGFQVTRYRTNPETLPEVLEAQREAATRVRREQLIQ